LKDDPAALDVFLSRAGWTGSARVPVAADFSARSFFRLTRSGAAGESAIMMLAGRDQKTEAFIAIAALLRSCGIAAPEIFAADASAGMVLMEDFGESKIGALLDAGAPASTFDAAAARLLARLHEKASPHLLSGEKWPVYDAAALAEQAAPFVDQELPRITGRAATAAQREDFIALWREALMPLDALPRSLVLRDFMPDNAMLLPNPVLGQEIGVIDFQDAGVGPIAYDLASWCEEVRRPKRLCSLPDVLTAYGEGLCAKIDPHQLLCAARLCVAQRHTRLWGRLYALGREAMLPSVAAASRAMLRDEGLANVRLWFEKSGVALS